MAPLYRRKLFTRPMDCEVAVLAPLGTGQPTGFRALSDTQNWTGYHAESWNI